MADQNYEWISYKLADGVATITFNAPQFGNALGLKGLQELLDALYRSEAREDVGAIVLTGRGKPFAQVSISKKFQRQTSMSKQLPGIFAF